MKYLLLTLFSIIGLTCVFSGLAKMVDITRGDAQIQKVERKLTVRDVVDNESQRIYRNRLDAVLKTPLTEEQFDDVLKLCYHDSKNKCRREDRQKCMDNCIGVLVESFASY